MTYDKAQRLIILSAVVTLGSTVSDVLNKPKSQKEELKVHRVIAGGFFAMMFCGILTEFDPDIGVGIASMVAIYTFGQYGLPALNEGFKKEGTNSSTSTNQPPTKKAVLA